MSSSKEVSYTRQVSNLPAFKKGKVYKGWLDCSKRYITMSNDMGSQFTYYIGSYFNRRDFEDLWGRV